MRFTLSRAAGLACLIRRKSVHSLIFTAALTGFVTACGGSAQPAAPEFLLPVSPPPVSPAPPTPALDTAVRTTTVIYLGDNNIYASSDSFFGGRLTSRYLLDTDSTFRLQTRSPAFGLGQYAGKYSRTDRLITFNFYGWSSLGSWEAIARISGDSLSVMYNIPMEGGGFVDGVYVRAR